MASNTDREMILADFQVLGTPSFLLYYTSCTECWGTTRPSIDCQA